MTKRGPNTETGRLAVRRNAWKHGITSDAIVITNDFEDPKLWEGIRQGVFDHYQPVGEIEHLLAERIAIAFWKLRRVDHYQMVATVDHIAGTKEDLMVAGAYAQGTLSKGIYPEISPTRLRFQQAKRQLPTADALTTIMRGACPP